MNSKFLFAVLSSTLTGFLVGWLIYGGFLSEIIREHSIQYVGLVYEMPLLFPATIANLTWSVLVVFIMQKWAGVNNLMRGLKVGFIISILYSVSYDFYLFAIMKLYDEMAVLLDILGNTVVGTAAGTVAGWVLGSGNKSEPD